VFGDDLHETEAADYDTARPLPYTEAVGPAEALPLLLVGSKLDKALPLRENRWILCGRGPKAQLRIDADGVSQEHCQFRWDAIRRNVEIRDKSTRGTYVNGTLLKGSLARRPLQHADQIVIEGALRSYKFVLDLRPVNLGFSNPISQKAQRSDIQSRKKQEERRVARLKSELQTLELQILGQNVELAAREREYYKLVAQRNMRRAKDKSTDEEVKQKEQERKQFEDDLAVSREKWPKEMRAQEEKNEATSRALAQRTADLQNQLEKMYMFRAQMERKVNPDKFETVAGFVPSPALPSHASPASAPLGGTPKQICDEDDEEEHALDQKPQMHHPTSPTSIKEQGLDQGPVSPQLLGAGDVSPQRVGAADVSPQRVGAASPQGAVSPQRVDASTPQPIGATSPQDRTTSPHGGDATPPRIGTPPDGGSSLGTAPAPSSPREVTRLLRVELFGEYMTSPASSSDSSSSSSDSEEKSISSKQAREEAALAAAEEVAADDTSDDEPLAKRFKIG
jgi:hypothetical protein